MKVLLANKFWFRNGGSEAVLFAERDFLLQSGFSVCEFAMEDPRNVPSAFAPYFVSNKEYRRSPVGALGSVANGLSLIHSVEAVRKFRALLDAQRPDIVHCHNVYHQLTPSIFRVAKSRGLPVVLTLHDYKPVCPTYLRLKHGTVCSDCIDGGVFNVVKNRCAEGSLGRSSLLYAEAKVHQWARSYERVDAVIAPSRFLANAVAGRFAPEHIHVVPNGVDTDRIQASDVDAGYVLYLGRVSKEKGIKTLLEAHKRAAGAFALKVCGTGPLLQALRGAAPDAEFLGHRTGNGLAEIIAAASLIVVPSECYENCPMSILEAMAFGKPVVASRIGGIPELVAHGETGLLANAGDAEDFASHIMSLMREPQTRRIFGRAARERAHAHFSLQQHNSALLSVYERLLNRGSGN